MFLAKTVIKALNKAKDAVGEEFAPDKEIWSQRIFRIQEGFQTKWQKVMDKFAKKEEKDASEDRNNNSTCDKKSETKEKNKKKSEFKPDKKTKNKKNKQVCLSSKLLQSITLKPQYKEPQYSEFRSILN